MRHRVRLLGSVPDGRFVGVLFVVFAVLEFAASSVPVGTTWQRLLLALGVGGSAGLSRARCCGLGGAPADGARVGTTAGRDADGRAG